MSSSSAKVRFTAKQQQAIDARGSDILVSAAAGSGKTAVLTERVARLIEEGTPIESMLVVTYTNAAAAQMRRRIVARLESSPMRTGNISSENICTIHSFCMTILREFFVEAGINPSFNIQEEGRGHRMREAAFSLMLDCMLEDDGVLETVSVFGGVESIKAHIMGIYQFMRSKPDSDSWLLEMLRRFEENALDIPNSSWAKEAAADAEKNALRAAELINEAYSIFENEKAHAILQSDSENVLRVIHAARTSYLALSSYTPVFARWVIPSKRGAEKPPEQEMAKELRDRAKKLLDEAVDLPPLNVSRETSEVMLEHLRRLCAMTLEFSQQLAKMKEDAGELDFSDLEHFALKALRNDDVCAAVRGRYKHVFIDEYQDANALQEEILKRVTRGDNLFMVGDVKQSIYGFRMAEPSLFADKYARFAAGDGGLRITMNDNFRSSKSVIDYVNFIFERVMRGGFGGVDYDDEARMSAGAKGDDVGATEKAELQVLSTGDAEFDPNEDFTNIQAETRLIIQNIRSLVGKEMRIDGVARPVELRDIAVLFRSPRKWIGTLEDMLRAAGIPFAADTSEGYYGLTEVKTVVDLLCVSDNRQQDIPLIGALTAPFALFTPGELAHIRTAYPEKGLQFHVACTNYAKEIGDSLAQRLNIFYEQLASWRVDSRKMPVYQLVMKVLEETGYYDFVGSLPHGNVRQENLRSLINRARSCETLSEFVSIAALGDEGSGEGASFSAVPENEQAVKIMSIHKSKGLEFPVVIVAGTGAKINLRDTQGMFVFHREKGFGLQYFDPENMVTLKEKTLSHRSVARAIKEDSISEELRVLYVAMTRAKVKLIITGCVNDSEKAEKRWQALAEDGDFSAAERLIDFVAPFSGDEKFVQLENECGDADFAEVGESISEAMDANEWVKARLEWEYAHRSQARPEKMNVTALARQSEHHIPPRPDFAGERHGLTGAERGTAVHSIISALDKKSLVYKDVSAAQLEIDRQIDDMLHRGLISMAQAKAVTSASLAAFFVSDIGTRALNSANLLTEQPFNIIVNPQEVGIDATGSDKILLQGIIDMCFEEESAWTVIDFKTGRLTRGEALLAYGGQIRNYMMAMERLTGKAANGYLYMLDMRELIGV